MEHSFIWIMVQLTYFIKKICMCYVLTILMLLFKRKICICILIIIKFHDKCLIEMERALIIKGKHMGKTVTWIYYVRRKSIFNKRIKVLSKVRCIAYTGNHSTWKVEAGGLWVQGLPHPQGHLGAAWTILHPT